MSSIKPSTLLSETTPLRSSPESTVTSTNPSRDCQPSERRVIFSMQNLQRLFWFFAVGFGASFLPRVLGTNAAPVDGFSGLIARDVPPTMNIFYKGRHYDNGTGYNFELYSHDDALDDGSAIGYIPLDTITGLSTHR